MNTEPDLLAKAKQLTTAVQFKDIRDMSGLNERVGCVNVYFINLIGVNDGYIELASDHAQPLDDEWLAFLWIVRPELSSEIAKRVKNIRFAMAIGSGRQPDYGLSVN
jgi:hypothetical protein